MLYSKQRPRTGSLLGKRGGDGLLNMSHFEINILAFAIRALDVKGRDRIVANWRRL